MFNKNLEQQIKDFENTVSIRQSKVKSKITGLEKESASLNKRIETNTDTMVEYELNEDAQSADKLRQENREMRLRISEIEGEIVSYRGQLMGSNSLFTKDIEKIKAAGLKAEEQRHEQDRLMRAEVVELEKQKKELDQKIEKMKNELGNSSNYQTINILKRVVRMIDPRFSKLSYPKDEQYVKNWMGGASVEGFFQAPERDKGPMVTYGSGHQFGHENEMSSGGSGNVPRL